jgi:peroxin-6
MSTILRECFATARAGWKSTGFPIIILATTCDVDKIPTAVLGSFKEEISVEVSPYPHCSSFMD